MERLEGQLRAVNNTQRAMKEPLKKERVRDVLDLKLPDLPQRHAQRVGVGEEKEKESVFVLE
jgi:hypothetical protein